MAELHKINEKIRKFALNKNHTKTQNDYINQLKKELNTTMNETEQIQKLEEIKKLNNLFMQTENIDIKELENLSADELSKKINNFFNSSTE